MVTILTGPLQRCMAEVIQQIGTQDVRQGLDRTAMCSGQHAYATDPVLQANELARAVYATLGNDLLGQGADPGYVVNALEQHAELFEGLSVVVLAAQYMPDLAARLAHTSRLRVFLQFDRRAQAPAELPRARYVHFLEAPAPFPEEASDGSLEATVRRYLRAGRPERAFALLTETGPDALRFHLDAIGWEMLAQGLSKYLYEHLTRLGGPLAMDPAVLRWRLASGLELGKQSEVLQPARQVLRLREDPELRAYVGYALHLAGDHETSLEYLEQAVEARPSATNLTLYGYVLQGQRPEESAAVLQRALARAETEDAAYLQAQIALTLAQAYYLACEPQQVLFWCDWALRVMERYHLANVWLRLLVLNEQASARMLLGDLVGLEDQIGSEVRSLSGGNPRVRNIMTSTLSEVLFLQGRYAEAAAQLELLWGRVQQRTSYAMFALNYVRALVEADQLREARQVADHAVALNEPSPLVFQCQARLAAAYVKLFEGPAGVANELRHIADALERGGQRPYALPARALEAYALLRSGRRAEAEQVLNRVRPLMQRFHRRAWELVVGPEHRFGSLFRLLEEEPKPLHLHFLGQMRAWHNGVPLTLHLRQAELLTALVLNPQGLSSRELAEAVYPDDGDTSRRLRSYMPHLREVVPVESEPYRLAVDVEADFERVHLLLARGDLRGALSLYQGPLLPASDSPLVEQERAVLERAIREAAVASRDAEALLHLAQVTRDDLELWDLAVEHLPKIDPRRAIAVARREQVLREYGLAPARAAPAVGGGGQSQSRHAD